MEMEPIPLRTLTVLLNYERVVSDPRFKDVRLMRSSIAEPDLIKILKANNRESMKGISKTVMKTNLNIFEPYAEPTTSEPPSTICLVHPKAGRDVQALTQDQLELMYYETRGYDGCFKALGLYQFFFDLCPPEQKISIQLTDEEPVIVGLQTRQIVEFKIRGPKLNSFTSIPSKSLTLHTGHREDERHAVCAFVQIGEAPGNWLVVDMSRMQYGEAGRGLHGENYFLGTFSNFLATMKNVCSEAVIAGMLHPRLGSNGNENEQRLRACAKKVWERWQNRETEGWCNFCGKPGPDLMNCGACKEKGVKIGYCSRQHQVSDWKLHKYTCEKNKK